MGGACGLEFLAEASDGALAPGATPLSVGSGQTHPFANMVFEETLPVVEETTVVVHRVLQFETCREMTLETGTHCIAERS